MSILISIIGFLAVLGPLVLVHEFGHYFFARLFGVKAEVFSLGFGPKLWSRQCGETELRVSAIPLGGYVKLLGEEEQEEPLPPELQRRTLTAQRPWKRFCIFFAGPLFNFLFAIVVFMAMLLIGEPQPTSTLARVVSGSPAAQSGLRSGDRVLAINGKAVRRYDELLMAVAEHPNAQVDVKVARPRDNASDVTMDLTVKTSAHEGFTVYGEMKSVGEISGIQPNPRDTQAGVSDPRSLAWMSGIRTGDRIVGFNGRSVQSWEILEELYGAAVAGPVSFKVERGEVKSSESTALSRRDVVLHKPAGSRSLGQDLGLFSSELFVEKVMPQSPAEAAGVKPGDRLISIGGQEVQSFFDLKDSVQKSAEQSGKVAVRWEREGVQNTATIVPTANKGRDAVLKQTVQYTVGVVPMLALVEPQLTIERTWNPFLLVAKATERMAVLTWRNVVSLRKMFTGDVSIGTLGGPILIGKIAGESITRGIIAFLTTMAILSVGLGILNVLPIPVLDGGHLLLLVIEMIRGKPLSIRQTEIVQQVGLSLILLLMVIVIRNDIIRLPFFN